MKKFWKQVYDARIWLGMFFLLDGSFIFLAWLAYPESFGQLLVLMIALSLVWAFIPLFLSMRKQQQIEEAYARFLLEPDMEQEEALWRLLPKTQQPALRKIASVLRQNEDDWNNHLLQVGEYEVYIEEWVHEIKKPLSLLTLILDNREDEMSPLVKQRLTYTRNEIQGDVEKMLYFSRLSTVHRDYLFQPIDLVEFCQEAIADHESLLAEADFQVCYRGATQTVVADRKSLLFMLSQLVHNSTKYARQAGTSLVFQIEKKEQVVLSVWDHGPGVPQEDLPFIFDKGFTGGQAKATGMGLYLVKRMAEDMKIEVRASTTLHEGLKISFLFPKVEQTNTTRKEEQSHARTKNSPRPSSNVGWDD